MSELRTAADMLNTAAPAGERLAYVNPNEEGLLQAIGGSGQEAAGGVPSYKKGDVEAPPPRDYGQETRDTLEAQIQLAPSLYSSEMNQLYGRPAYARGERSMLWESLLGDQGQQGQQGGYGAYPSPSFSSVQQPAPTGQGGGKAQVEAAPSRAAQDTGFISPISFGGQQRQQKQPGGLLELYEEHLAPSLMRQQAAAVTGEIDMLRELGPLFIEAQRSADPRSENIRQMLQERAMEGLEARQSLTPEELAGVTESVRSGQAARGEAYQRSQPAMIEETMARLGAGRQAENERIARASALLGQTGQIDPLMGLFGRSARIPGQVAGQMGTSGFALQAGPQLFNPESAYAGALAGSNQANIMNARMATSANKAAITGGMMQGLGSLGGGMFAGGLFS